ncbi:MAG: hypothetical protein KBF54_13940 [Rhizobiales bacterium]|nr:hypothetical protein [Hyphomicrobiales bacterium]
MGLLRSAGASLSWLPVAKAPSRQRRPSQPIAHLVSLGGDHTGKMLTAEGMMNVLQGQFYSTAFRVIDDDLFAADTKVLDLRQFLDIHQGREGDDMVYCITSAEGTPKIRIRATKKAVCDLLADAEQSKVALDDDRGWIETLQKHLHPDFGIVVIHEGAEEYMTYIVSDCAGWTR